MIARRGIRLSGSNAIAVALCLLSLTGIALGFAEPPSPSVAGGSWPLAVEAIVRIVLTLAMTVTLVLGPGLAVAQLLRRKEHWLLGLAWIPGVFILAATGTAAWVFAGHVRPQIFCAIMIVPLLLVLLVVAIRAGQDAIVDATERRVLSLALAVLVVALAKALYAPGPVGELYAGSISRTLEVGDRPDSRIPYHVVQLIANGTPPYSNLGRANFLPYVFSDRGPLAGLAASPVVLLSGATVPVGVPSAPWAPFDGQGFMAYRLAMSAFAVTALLSLFGLLAAVLRPAAGLFVVALAALTPFVVHEVYFTWPKLLAASFVIAGALLIVHGRPGWAGLMAGAGYMAHSLALLSVPTLGLLWILLRARGSPAWHFGDIARGLAWLAAGTAAWLLFWRVVNLRHYAQSNFLLLFVYANSGPTSDPVSWVRWRIISVLNTLVPFFLFVFGGRNPSVNSVNGPSPGVVHFYFQYWNALPFGVGIAFFPLLIGALVRVFLRTPWLAVVVALSPIVLFSIYWGGPISGMLREGLQVWILALLALYAWSRFREPRPLWYGSRLERIVLSGRALEVLLMLLLPTLLTSHVLISRQFALTDAIALATMIAGLGWLGRQMWAIASPTQLADA